MGLTVDDAKELAQMRLRLLENKKKGLPAEHGIDKEKLKDCLELIRKDRSLGDATGSKAKAKAPVIPMDLDAFMNKVE